MKRWKVALGASSHQMVWADRFQSKNGALEFLESREATPMERQYGFPAETLVAQFAPGTWQYVVPA